MVPLKFNTMKSFNFFLLLNIIAIFSFSQPCIVTQKWGDTKPVYSTVTGKPDTGYYKVWNENGQYGLVTYSAELVVPMLYDDDFETTGNLLVVKNRNKKLIDLWDLVKKSKVKLPGVNGNMQVGNNGLIAVEAANRKWGYCDTKGKMFIPFKYDYALAFVNGNAVIMIGEKFGVINDKGVVVIPSKYSDLLPVGQHLLITRVDSKDGATSNYGLIDYKMKPLVPEIYKKATQRDGVIEFEKHKRANILYNNNGNVLTEANVYVPTNGNKMLRVEDGRIVVVGEDKKWFVIDTTGKKYLTDKYYFLYTPQSRLTKQSTDVYLFASQPGENVNYGVVKLDGTVLLQDVYADIIAATENRFYTKLPGSNIKYSLMDGGGKSIITDLCDECLDFSDVYLIAKKNNKIGVINSLTGEIVVPFIYDKFNSPNNCYTIMSDEKAQVTYNQNFIKQ